MASSMSHVSLLPCILDFTEFSESIHNYVLPQPKIGEKCVKLTKTLYDQASFSNCTTGLSVLPELITHNFDDEQVWQQLELSNKAVIPFLLEKISKAAVKKNVALGTVVEAKREETPDLSSSEHDSANGLPSSSKDIPKKRQIKQKKHKVSTIRSKVASEVEDKFFNLSQLEKFLNREDAKEEKPENEESSSEDDDAENVNYFDELPSSGSSEDDEEDNDESSPKKSSRDAKYGDFFDPPLEDTDHSKVDTDDNEESNDSNNELSDLEYDTRDVEDDKGPTTEDLWSSRHKDLSPAGEADSESDVEKEKIIVKNSKLKQDKSTFQKQQEKLKETISKVEEANLSEKPWQLKGEVNAEGRPENSLLEEHLKFDHLVRKAPVITEETTKTIEEIILQRVKDKAWDDVERKVKPKEIPFEYKRRVVLDQEKSKLSLAEIYEKEYIKQRQNEKEEKQVPEHNAIRSALAELFSKLDALSNFHYMPKAPSSEIRIVNNLPAITVEDVAPVNISDAGLLAPEEVQGKVRGEIKGSTERSKTDRKRERRAKKLLQHKRRLAKEAKSLKPSLQTKQSRLEARKAKKANKSDDQGPKVKSLNSSTAFFAMLQDKVQSDIQDHIKKKNVNTRKTSQALKL